ncbi:MULTISPECIES: ABC transporter permease subunit [Fictibacillus]|uniref:ABC transporter permease subunit n=1 Tax=Fictibacillus TaxID=1329200 RepID=UPI0018CDF933|nr:ABC transporter permease subunit [Fictibacillus sp. 26RED30]MBH0162680.1 ABC transporter permease subunit [Fictibacillus sp. 26RED30]
MKMNFIKNVVPLLLTICMIVVFGAIPILIVGTEIHVSAYLIETKNLILSLLHPHEITYYITKPERPLFPEIFNPYLYSLTVYFSAFFLSILLGLLLSFVTINFFSKSVKRFVSFLVFVLESLPDLFIVAVIQMGIVWFFKKSGILVMSFTSLPDERSYFIPIIALSILPTVQFFKMFMLSLEEEIQMDYVVFARAKGIPFIAILPFHVFRNTLMSIFYQSKSILWMMLSNLLVLEYILNMNGFTSFLFMYLSPELFVVALIMLLLPTYLLLLVFKICIKKLNNEEVVL